jgi:leucyl aminopeptidase
MTELFLSTTRSPAAEVEADVLVVGVRTGADGPSVTRDLPGLPADLRAPVTPPRP